MIFGVDLTPIQNPHRERGIGSVVINFINNLPPALAKKHRWVFFLEPFDTTKSNPLDILKLEGVNYELRYFVHPTVPRLKLKLLAKLITAVNGFRAFRYGEPKIRAIECNDLDAYLQVDPLVPLPKLPTHTNKVLMLHDAIPYILEADYLWNYKTARKHGQSRLLAFRTSLRRPIYKIKMKAALRNATRLLADSEQTKHDFVQLFGAKPTKVEVTYLGVNTPDDNLKQPTIQYTETLHGCESHKLHINLSKTPYLFFTGGVDPRRKVQDLVHAFDLLRSKNINIKLVLAGNNSKGPKSMHNDAITSALEASPYLNDIIFLGFISNAERNWLYKNALAFVFPSVYEGFGLPVLEAMSYDCPVIAYENGAVQEIAGGGVLFSQNADGIAALCMQLLNDQDMVRRYKQLGKKQAGTFSWRKTVRHIIQSMEKAPG